jgi:hypothetical protein
MQQDDSTKIENSKHQGDGCDAGDGSNSIWRDD